MLTNFLVVRPATGEMMAVDQYGPAPIVPTANQSQSPKLLPTRNLAENYQSVMNLDHGGDWEIASLDLAYTVLKDA